MYKHYRYFIKIEFREYPQRSENCEYNNIPKCWILNKMSVVFDTIKRLKLSIKSCFSIETHLEKLDWLDWNRLIKTISNIQKNGKTLDYTWFTSMQNQIDVYVSIVLNRCFTLFNDDIIAHLMIFAIILRNTLRAGIIVLSYFGRFCKFLKKWEMFKRRLKKESLNYLIKSFSFFKSITIFKNC